MLAGVGWTAASQAFHMNIERLCCWEPGRRSRRMSPGLSGVVGVVKRVGGWGRNSTEVKVLLSDCIRRWWRTGGGGKGGGWRVLNWVKRCWVILDGRMICWVSLLEISLGYWCVRLVWRIGGQICDSVFRRRGGIGGGVEGHWIGASRMERLCRRKALVEGVVVVRWLDDGSKIEVASVAWLFEGMRRCLCSSKNQWSIWKIVDLIPSSAWVFTWTDWWWICSKLSWLPVIDSLLIWRWRPGSILNINNKSEFLLWLLVHGTTLKGVKQTTFNPSWAELNRRWWKADKERNCWGECCSCLVIDLLLFAFINLEKQRANIRRKTEKGLLMCHLKATLGFYKRGELEALTYVFCGFSSSFCAFGGESVRWKNLNIDLKNKWELIQFFQFKLTIQHFFFFSSMLL